MLAALRLPACLWFVPMPLCRPLGVQELLPELWELCCRCYCFFHASSLSVSHVWMREMIVLGLCVFYQRHALRTGDIYIFLSNKKQALCSNRGFLSVCVTELLLPCQMSVMCLWDILGWFSSSGLLLVWLQLSHVRAALLPVSLKCMQEVLPLYCSTQFHWCWFGNWPRSVIHFHYWTNASCAFGGSTFYTVFPPLYSTYFGAFIYFLLGSCYWESLLLGAQGDPVQLREAWDSDLLFFGFRLWQELTLWYNSLSLQCLRVL